MKRLSVVLRSLAALISSAQIFVGLVILIGLLFSWQTVQSARQNVEANLERADREDNLQKTDLRGANLQGGILRGANLEGAILREANLQGVDLREANLQGAILGGANLERASLWNVNLQGAILWNANLQEARDLTIEQLSKVKTLYGAKLDPPLMEQIKREYPHLLEKPKPEETEGK